MSDERKTQPVPKIYPFNLETVRLIAGDPDAAVSRTTLSLCEICSQIPDSLDLEGEKSVKPVQSAARLKDHAEVRTSLKMLKCPVCGSLYKLERPVELIPGSVGKEWALTRLTGRDAYELLIGQQARAVLKRGDTWVFEG